MQILSVGSIFWFAFSNKDAIRAAAHIDHASMEHYKVFHRELLNRGVYLGPSGYEVGFVSNSHTEAVLDEVKNVIFEALAIVFES
jgi:glutamate-1-semialdehyde 2,1-aminomutase